jgi:hypothetical protein
MSLPDGTVQQEHSDIGYFSFPWADQTNVCTNPFINPSFLFIGRIYLIFSYIKHYIFSDVDEFCCCC